MWLDASFLCGYEISSRHIYVSSFRRPDVIPWENVS